MTDLEMSDLEITRLCAEAMGIKSQLIDSALGRFYAHPGGYLYDPLHDDTQAMALAKRFMLEVDFFAGQAQKGEYTKLSERFTCWNDESINYAICECVAKMQQAKEGA